MFVCGDHHFSHKNIMKYDGRPFSSVEEMNEIMIERHNEIVGKSDLVYSVGDFCFGGTEEWKKIRRRMNGDWHLVKGNHDRQSRKFLRELFSTVQEIKNLRERLMLNQQEFADVMAVGSGTVSRWERGERRPRAVHLRRMARYSKKVNNAKS